MRIGEFSKKTNISIKTLRYYDELGVFKPSIVDKFTGYRDYTLEQINDIEIFNNLRNCGFELKELRDNDMINLYKSNDRSDLLQILSKKKLELLEKSKMILESINYIDSLEKEGKNKKIYYIKK